MGSKYCEKCDRRAPQRGETLSPQSPEIKSSKMVVSHIVILIVIKYALLVIMKILLRARREGENFDRAGWKKLYSARWNFINLKMLSCINFNDGILWLKNVKESARASESLLTKSVYKRREKVFLLGVFSTSHNGRSRTKKFKKLWNCQYIEDVSICNMLFFLSEFLE